MALLLRETGMVSPELIRDKVIPVMQVLRGDIDALEMVVPADMWPVPTYADLLFKL